MSLPIASGSIIQGWAAGYYTNDQWAAEFGYMKEAAITKLIVASTVDESSDAAVPSYAPTTMLSMYPSAIPGVNIRADLTPGTDTPPLETILRYAEANGVQVYLGLNLYFAAWFYGDPATYTRTFITDPNWCLDEATRGNAIATELVNLYLAKYPHAFAGWYWPWEIDNSPEILADDATAKIVQMLNANLDHLADISPGLPVILSPFYNPTMASPDTTGAFWQKVFAQMPNFGANGILAPQDGIGAGDVALPQVAPYFEAFQQALVTKPGVTLWANCETFMGNPPVTAPMDRVIQQFQTVAPFVSDIITFSYSHYDSPLHAEPSVQAQWVAYVNSVRP